MVWLTDDLHHTVRKFTPEGKHLLTIGNPDTPAELQGGQPFNRPTHVAICPKSGYLFVSDGYGNSRVHKYSPDGEHVMSWGEPGTDPGQFNLPHNLVTDRDGLVYVADRENHRVQIFDGKGGYQGQWNNLHRPCGLFADRAHDLFFVGELGSGMPVNEKTPNLGPRVSVLDGKGQRRARFGGQFASEKPGEFIAPHGLVVDSRGDVYVGEVSWTGYGQFLTPPRVMRSFQKFRRAG
jgi:DNA-binding beta-propeller fold protein YncE